MQVIPDTILYLSYFYPSRAVSKPQSPPCANLQLPIRLAFFWMSSNFVDIIGGFSAVGLLKMRGLGGYPGWSWLFMIEGLVTRKQTSFQHAR